MSNNNDPYCKPIHTTFLLMLKDTPRNIGHLAKCPTFVPADLVISKIARTANGNRNERCSNEYAPEVVHRPCPCTSSLGARALPSRCSVANRRARTCTLACSSVLIFAEALLALDHSWHATVPVAWSAHIGAHVWSRAPAGSGAAIVALLLGTFDWLVRSGVVESTKRFNSAHSVPTGLQGAEPW